MLAEHIVILPVLQAIFQDRNVIGNNSVIKLIESMVRKFHGLENEKENLQKFCKSIEEIDLIEDRQKLIKTLFEKLFKFDTPSIEIVDFIINSVSEILKKEFNQSIAKENIKILDPFAGDGTFIVRLLEKFKKLGIDNEL
ncbi:hypothetical protein [[Mycoplasma] cavipharyngis]|uniref:hypothetical protein n=1 Tax=[Mycoplasma] cavipharyngis TaxID=92757 RepID=UPI003703BECA